MCATYIEQYGLIIPEAAQLLHGEGWYLREHAQYGQAETLLQQALGISKKAFGSESAETASMLHSLAQLYLAQNQYDMAKAQEWAQLSAVQHAEQQSPDGGWSVPPLRPSPGSPSRSYVDQRFARHRDLHFTSLVRRESEYALDRGERTCS